MNTEVENEYDIDLTVTDAAVSRLKELLEDESEDLSLRVFITGGGCSGFQYGFTFEDKISDEDSVKEVDGIKVVVDSMSFQYLSGAKIDFKNEMIDSRFVIDNPHAQQTCGCGSSFSV